MHQGVVGFGKGRLAGGTLLVEQLLQRRIVKRVGNRPRQPGSHRQSQVFGDHPFGNLERPGNRLKA